MSHVGLFFELEPGLGGESSFQIDTMRLNSVALGATSVACRLVANLASRLIVAEWPGDVPSQSVDLEQPRMLALLPGRLYRRGVIGNTVEATAFFVTRDEVRSFTAMVDEQLRQEIDTQEYLVAASSVPFLDRSPPWLGSPADNELLVWTVVCHTRGVRAFSPTAKVLRKLDTLGKLASPIVKACVEAVTISCDAESAGQRSLRELCH